MLVRKSKISRRTLWIGALMLALALLFLFAFGSDIVLVFRRIFVVLLAFLGFPLPEIDYPTRRAFNIVIFFNLIGGFGVVFGIWLLLISAQAILPVSGIRDVARTAFHLVMYILRRHGPAVFVRDGELKATSKELNREKRGVVVEDFNSAVVLEETIPPPSVSRLFERFRDNLLIFAGLADPYRNPRACGPGIVFTRKRERIRTAVDLRKQFRFRPDNLAYTRDGIEVKASVLSMFTVGQDPDEFPIFVTYLGERRAENLQEVFLDKLPGDRVRVRDISPDLEQDDMEEIHHWMWIDLRRGQMQPYEEPSTPSQLPVFNENRVFATVFSEARNDKDEVIPWYDLPNQVAVDLYRRLLLQYNYDQLYDSNDPNHFPIPLIRKKLRLAMRNNGLLSYRMLLTKDNTPVEKGKEYSRFDLRLSPMRQLTRRKVLRSRGIRIIMASIGDLVPVSDAIYQQRLDNVLATWERDTEVITASREVEAIRVRSRARRQAQQEMERAFAQIFESRDRSQEILAIQVMQTLETMASESKTRRLLPAETLELMKQLNIWLLPPSGPGQQGTT